MEFSDRRGAGEAEEGFSGFTALGVGGEEALDFRGQVSETDRWDEFACETLILIGAAADDDLVALFAGDLHAHEADVADVVLGAGVMAAGDVQIDRLIKIGKCSSR